MYLPVFPNARLKALPSSLVAPFPFVCSCEVVPEVEARCSSCSAASAYGRGPFQQAGLEANKITVEVYVTAKLPVPCATALRAAKPAAALCRADTCGLCSLGVCTAGNAGHLV